MSDYDYRPGGSLKLKGGVVDGGIVKKKKKSKSKGKEKEKEKDVADKASERLAELEKVLEDEQSKSASPSGSRHDSPAAMSTDKKTAAEKRFEETQRKRLARKVEKLSNTTHKDRVAEFNSKLEALSEHHDIPKVGPG